ncbi:MAG: type II toxin-antitoxin system PemK/MazF family toxin [Gammaproteobacteria bacterium]|nr:type II toxin-antitoxin system PemK/MazF family toxin [Gammaproteobacteria bacterium]MCY4227136.1 type II toxin-antitoxin system PemK/MazF family toxin [Gammaproteobacteria bacterium]
MEKPQRMPVNLRIAPRKSEVYWCDYPSPECLHLPEFWKRRPVVIISRYPTLRGVVTVVPMTSKVQYDPRFSIMVRSPVDGRDAWIICNHVTTVAISRLLPINKRSRISEKEYQDVMDKVAENLARA